MSFNKEYYYIQHRLVDFVSSMYDVSFENGLRHTREIIDNINFDRRLYDLLLSEFVSRLDPSAFVYPINCDFVFFKKNKKYIVDGSDLAMLMESANVDKLSGRIGKIDFGEVDLLMLELYEVQK